MSKATSKTTARNALFGQALQKRRKVTASGIPGFEADVVSLSGADRRDLSKRIEGMDVMQQQVAILIAAYRVTGTDEALLTVGDTDSLMALPGDVLDELALPALAINGMAVQALEGAEGNSETTPSSSSGSPLPSDSGA